MAVDYEALRKCLRYMRLESTVISADEFDDIAGFFEAAQEYLSDAGVPIPTSSQPQALYLRTVYALTLYYYDHRDAVGTAPTALRPSIEALKGRACVARAAAAYAAE